jgi:non-ribosomal peptide synthetase component F
MVEAMATAHETLLQALAEQPQAWTSSAPECLPSDQTRTRQAVNATTRVFEDVLLHQPFWHQAARNPDAIAVIDPRRVLTYGDLRAGAARLADRVHPHRMVAVITPKGWEQIVAVTGILAAGAAYVPISPDVPAARLHHLIRQAEITLAVTPRGGVENLTVPHIEVDHTILTGTEPPPIRPERTTADLAYVIYTSGSAGLPKGVMISHRSAVNAVLDINHRWHVGPSDRVFALSALGFDLSVYDIFGLLAAGGAIVLPAPDTERAPWGWTDQHRVTVWNSVPALMDMLVGSSVRDRAGPVDQALAAQFVQDRAMQSRPQTSGGPVGEPAVRGGHGDPERRW